LSTDPFTLQLGVSYLIAGLWLLLAAWRSVAWVRDRDDALRLLPVVLGASVLATRLVPHAPWQTNFHGFSRVAGVEDAGWWARLGEGALHGTGWIAASRLVEGLTFGLLGAFGVDTLIALGALVGVAVWTRDLLEDDAAGLAAACVLACTPIWLRLVPTVSPYVTVVVALAIGLAAAGRWSRDGARADGLLAALSAMWLCDLHAEFVVLGPVFVLAGGLGVRAERRRWLRPEVASALVVVVAFAAIRLIGVQGWLGGGGEGGLAERLWQGVGSPARLPLLRALLVVTALVIGRRALPERVEEPAARLSIALCLLAMGLAVGLRLELGTYDPEVGPPLGPWAGQAYLHPWWHAGYTPPVWPVASAVGVLIVGWRRPVVAWGLVAAVAALTGFYTGRIDAFATWVRTGLPASLGLAVLAGVAVARVHRLGLRGGLPRPALAAGWAGLAFWTVLPYGSWLAYRFPMQQEFELLDAVRRSPDRSPVAMLAAEDATAAVDPVRHYARFRGYAFELLAGAGDRTITSLSAFTREGSPPAWYVRGLGCYRAVLPEAGPSGAEPQTLVVADLRWWMPERGQDSRVRPTEVAWYDVYRADRRWDLDRFAPCWDQPEARRCAIEGPEGCAAWTCAPGAVPAGRTYLDPACAAFEAAWELEPVLRVPVAGGETSQASSTVITDGAELVLFKVVARRP
jgi:hypothetical protein